MKIKPWWTEHEIREAGYHIIGTCGECEYFKMFGSPSLVDKCTLFGIERSQDFGCIHFAEQTPFEPKGKIKGNSALKKDIK